MEFHDVRQPVIGDSRRPTPTGGAEREASSRLALVGELVSSVTHDLRQPLTAIEMNLSAAIHLLRRSDPAILGAIDALTDALAQQRRMGAALQLLEDLAARREPLRGPCDLGAITREAITLLQSDALARHVPIELDIGLGVPAISGDVLLVRQALLDILIGALESSSRSSQSNAPVRVSVRSTADGAEVAVAHVPSRHDDGARQSRPCATWRWPAPSSMPTARHSRATRPPTPASSSSPAGLSMRDDAPLVAVIDDDEATCRAVARLLDADGYRVRTYTNGREYLDESDVGSPACVLVDIRMPELDGLTLVRAMRDAGGDVPAVFMTATGDVPTVVEAMREGAVDLLAKPFTAEALSVAIARATDSSRRQRASPARAG